MEEAIRDPRMVLSVVTPRTAGAASATRTTEEATVKEATIEQATTVVAIVAAVEGTMGDPRMVLLVVVPRTAVQGKVATRTM